MMTKMLPIFNTDYKDQDLSGLCKKELPKRSFNVMNPIHAAIKLSCTAPLLFGFMVQAQAIDPAVRLPQTVSPLTPPSINSNFRINGGQLDAAAPGGARFVLNDLTIRGNSLIESEQLKKHVENYIGQAVDFSMLEEMANSISRLYRESGYPFARAYLPEQDVKDGMVEVEILEGRYGNITAVNAPASTPAMVLQSMRNKAINDVMAALTLHFDASELTSVIRSLDDMFDARMQKIEAEYSEIDIEKTPNTSAQAFLKELKTGEVIEASKIERISLIMDDIPGYTVVPVVRPGSTRGTGDLEMRMIESDKWLAVAGLDNHGSLASGRHRLRFDMAKSRNFVFGDLINLTGLVTDENTWLTSISYGLPLNSSGVRLKTNLMNSSYKLGAGEFANIAEGKTTRMSFKVVFPVVRTQEENLNLSAGVEKTEYSNTLVAEESKYSIESVPVGLEFDWRDSFAGGGVTYGNATFQYNSVKNEAASQIPRYSYNLFNLNMAREQRISDRAKAVARFSIQHADEKIDSSHHMSLGGVNAVRAFPVGEFSGYRGSSLQIEASYSFPEFSSVPYIFFDAAQAKRVKTQDLQETRSMSGYGIGIKTSRLGLSIDLSAAWKASGGKSVSEPGMHSPRFWFSISSRL
jgi:hemolysin activation/secretion protein